MPTSRFTITSPSFSLFERIPNRHSAQGENVSPPLRWSNAPRDTAELALLCEDPDTRFPSPFVHWLIYGISPSVSSLPDGLPTLRELELPVLARQGRNSLMRIGYTGPNPPLWHGAHHYIFRLFALRTPLALEPGAIREQFLHSIEGKVIAESRLVGTYQWTTVQRARAMAPWLGAGAAAVGAWKAVSKKFATR